MTQKGFTLTNEKQGESLLASCSSAVGAKPQRGFTLIEVLVAVALFTIVVTVSVGALLVILDSNRKAQNISNTINNAFFSFETITRLMRTGVNYHCGSSGQIVEPRDCPGGDTEIYFTDDRGQFVHVWFDNSSATGTIMQEVDEDGPSNGLPFGPQYPLTADDFDVEHLTFTVTGSETVADGNRGQPLTTVVLDGITNKGKKWESDLKLQTTVTQRMLDL